ncbi:hypothetical protein ARMGADRAFT_174896 [Armillaria gallica]|uniref:Transcription factor TFIIIC triple barrel domain-containing protein n=1 Tax=Armillaria gallica TaxID=47427 RepID=A0A2H3CR77_ARMGA|nr:hypothetical protein ARMGADRAFT_174896 [Armillaria gallica]
MQRRGLVTNRIRLGGEVMVVVISKRVPYLAGTLSLTAMSLCLGYHRVTQFGPGDGYEEEEIFYVTLELGNVEPTLIPSCDSYHLVGLDTPTPSLQLAGTVLNG